MDEQYKLYVYYNYVLLGVLKIVDRLCSTQVPGNPKPLTLNPKSTLNSESQNQLCVGGIWRVGRE